IVLAGKKEQILDLNTRKTEAEARLKGKAQEAADINFLKEWDNTTVSWIDELYDLTARFPFQQGFRLESITVSPAKKKPNSKDKFVATMTLTGVVQRQDQTKVNDLVEEINKAGLRATPGQHGGTSTANANQSAFSITVDLPRQAPEKYKTKLTPPRG